MKPSHLLFGLAGAVVALLFWQFSEVQGELAALRAELGALKASKANVPVPQENGARPIAGSSASVAAPADSRVEAVERRLDDLENTVADLADAWNRFAAQEDEKRRRASMRAWGPEQATGAPDAPAAGDHPNAWASRAPDGGSEWLETGYDKPVDIAQVRVLENFAPGAVVRITAILDGGAEVPLWEGNEPQLPAPADQWFTARANVVASKVRIYLDTAKVPGWNEIDAVELIGRDGSRQWATSATASSTYAQGRGGVALEGLTIDGFGFSGGR
jgi:hypothetical protein